MSNVEVKKTSLEDVIAEQKKIVDYFATFNPTTPISYRVITGDRGIGKTHLVVGEMYRYCRPRGTAFMLLYRKKTDMRESAEAICDKYGHLISGKSWTYNSGKIYEYDPETNKSEVIAYVYYLNGAESFKTRSIENPRIEHYYMDEVFIYSPLARSEFRCLNIIVGTGNRGTGLLHAEATVWLTGNPDEGSSPILENLKVNIDQPKARDTNWIVYNSRLESPDPSINNRPGSVRKIEVGKETPLGTWSYLGVGYAVYQMPSHLYVDEYPRKGAPISGEMVSFLMRHLMRQQSYMEPIVYGTPKCTHLKGILRQREF